MAPAHRQSALISAAIAALAAPRCALAQTSPDSGTTFYNAPTFREWPFPGDANRDAVIDAADIARVTADSGQTGMTFIPRVIGRGGPDMDGPVGDGIFGFLWSDFNHDRIVNAADLAITQSAIVSMSTGGYALNADGSVQMGGTEYGQARVFPEGPIDFDTWNGVFYPYNRQPQRVLLTHLGIYDPETGVRIGPNVDPMLPGVFVLTGRYLETIATPLNNPPDYLPFGRFTSTNNDFRIDYTGAANGLATESISWFSEASLYLYITEYRRQIVNDEFTDSLLLAPYFATNMKHRQFRPDLIDEDPVNDLRAGKPIGYAGESTSAFGVNLYPVWNSAVAALRSRRLHQASLPPISVALEPDVWVGDYPALISTSITVVNRAFPSELGFGQNNQWIGQILPALSDGWSAWTGYRIHPEEERFYRYTSAGITEWEGQPCPTGFGGRACDLANTARNCMMSDESDTSRNGVFPFSWPSSVSESNAFNTGACLAGVFFAALYFDLAHEAGLGVYRTDLLSWKVISLLDSSDFTLFGMRQFGVRLQQAARMLWPDPAFPAWPDPMARSIYEQDIADVLTSRGVPINGVADFRTLLPPAVGPVVPAIALNFATSHPSNQPTGYNQTFWLIRAYTTPGPPAAYVSYRFYKHSKYGPCDHVRFSDGTFNNADESYNNDGSVLVQVADRQFGNLSLFMPGNTVNSDTHRQRCASEGTIDAAGLSGAYWEDVKAFGYIVTQATPNGFSLRITRLGETLSPDRRADRIRYQLDIEDPSLSLAAPLGRNATYTWTFTEYNGPTVQRAGRRVIYPALTDQPFTIAITRTRPPVNINDPPRIDTLTLRERGSDLDRPGITPGSGGGGPATAPGYALVYNGTQLTTPPFCAGDFNDNGTLSVQDIFDFLAAYFANDQRTDINQSGTISVQDIFDFLAAYFAGC